MDKKFISPSKSDSGYSSMGSSPQSAKDKTIEEKDRKLVELFAKFLTKLSEKPQEWEETKTEFESEVLSVKVDLIKKISSYSGMDFKVENQSFSWRDIDNSISKLEWNGYQEKKPGTALFEISKSRAILEKGFFTKLVSEYIENYPKNYEIIFQSSDPRKNNLLHCLAIVLAEKVSSLEEIERKDWEIYNEVSNNCQIFKAGIEEEKNVWGQTTQDILKTVGLEVNVEVFSI